MKKEDFLKKHSQKYRMNEIYPDDLKEILKAMDEYARCIVMDFSKELGEQECRGFEEDADSFLINLKRKETFDKAIIRNNTIISK